MLKYMRRQIRIGFAGAILWRNDERRASIPLRYVSDEQGGCSPKAPSPFGEADFRFIAALLLTYNLFKVARSGTPCTEPKLGFQTLCEFVAACTKVDSGVKNIAAPRIQYTL